MTKRLSSRLQNIIDLLSDGKCHTFDELQKVTNLSERQIDAAIAFLVDYGFVEMNKRIEARITSVAEKLFKQTL
jgi:predicted transcriptional regulator